MGLVSAFHLLFLLTIHYFVASRMIRNRNNCGNETLLTEFTQSVACVFMNLMNQSTFLNHSQSKQSFTINSNLTELKVSHTSYQKKIPPLYEIKFVYTNKRGLNTPKTDDLTILPNKMYIQTPNENNHHAKSNKIFVTLSVSFSTKPESIAEHIITFRTFGLTS